MEKESKPIIEWELIGLEEAAQMCKSTTEAIRQLVACKPPKIRGKKIGREWRFDKQQFQEDIKALLESSEQWESTQEKTASISGSRTRTQTVREYEKALGLRKEPKKANSSLSIC